MRHILARLNKWWFRLTAAPMERVICACGTWYWRIACEHPDTYCSECRDQQMDRWIENYQAREAARGSFIRRVS